VSGARALVTGMTQKDLRKWMRSQPGFASFSVLCHPMTRLIRGLSRPAATRDRRAAETRDVLSEPLQRAVGQDGNRRTTDFWLSPEFLKGHLKGQTSLRIPADWATQAALLQAAAQVALPQRIDQGTEAEASLHRLAEPLGVDAPDRGLDDGGAGHWPDILRNADLQKAVFDAYRKDFVQFGFERSAPE
jgi:hypothetical protein